ncbi:MAG: TIGR00730 family Rossman fold protein [Planctomycetaceae bacterium]|nr:TIGR00730 family Rossman fold protein [Planctomycetaceae bacterium]
MEASEPPWRRVCVFAGSQSGVNGEYRATAAAFGRLLVSRNLGLVYGGGSVGLMGVIADAVLESGGEAIGVIPDFLATRELLHPTLTETIITADMHTRKAKMASLADAFIAMPGGLGTFEEFFEVLTWAQLGVHRKPIGLLNVAGFYDPVLELINHSIQTGFVRAEHRDLLEADADPARLLDKLDQKSMPQLPKWTNLSET